MPTNLSDFLSSSFTGLQGTQGVQGRQGTQGLQGIQGIQGIQGLQGLQGNNNGGVTVTNTTTNTTAYIGFVTTTSGISTVVGIGTTLLQFNPATGAVGIGTVIDIIPYDTLNSGTLSWEGSAGQLFSITNNLTSGSIFSVNDVSGIPSIDVNADGTIQFGAYGGNIGIGITNPTSKLYVAGNTLVTGISTFTNGPVIVGSSSSTGTASQKLQVSGGAYVSGNLGIGTTNPIVKLDIVGGTLYSGGLSGDAYFVTYADVSGANVSIEAINRANTIKKNLTLNAYGGNVIVGGISSTGTASQPLQVTGGAYVSGSVGLGTTNPTQELHVQGDVRITGGIYDSNNNVGAAGSVLISTGSGVNWSVAASDPDITSCLFT